MNLSHEFSVSFVHSPLLTHRWVLRYTFKMGKEVSSCLPRETITKDHWLDQIGN